MFSWLHVKIRETRPMGHKRTCGIKPKCQSSSKTTTERNLRDDIILAVKYLNDLEITFPLLLPERSINFFKDLT